MKICIITGLYKKHSIGGGEIYVQKIANELSKNHEVIIITTSPDASLKSTIEMDGDIKVYTFRPLLSIYDVSSIESLNKIVRAITAAVVGVWNPHSYWIIKGILKKEKPDVIHTNTSSYVSTSTFSAIKSVKIPCIHTCHSYGLLCIWPSLFNYRKEEIIKNFNFLDRRYMDIKQYLTRSVDVVTAPSKFALDMHLKYGFFKDAKHVVLPLGIELNDIKKIEKDYETIDILYVGRLVSTKGVQILINAFKQLEHENIRLHVVGKGPDAEYFKNCMGSDSMVIFHGFVPDEKLMQFYKKANVTVVPSIWYDNSPVVIYESFMNGTLVIGSRIGGIPELVKDGYNGFLFEAGNVDELKDKLKYLIENPSELKRLEGGAFESVKMYDMDKHIRKLEDLYLQAIGDMAKQGGGVV